MRRISILIGVAAFVAFMGIALRDDRGSSAGSSGYPDLRQAKGTDRAHRLRVRGAAERDTRARLEALRLPPGATRVAKAPQGRSGELKAPFIAPETPNLIDDSAFWSVPGDPTEVLAWLKVHPSRSSKLKIESSSSDRDVTTSWSLGFDLPSIAGIADERALLVTAVTTAANETALRVDAQSVWIEPRPSSERIPVASQLLELSVGRAGAPPRELSIVDAKAVRRIAAAINDLPVVQPGVTSCPARSLRPVIVRLVFRAARGASALAEVEQRMPAGTCDPMRLDVHGERGLPLAESWRVMRSLRPLLGRAR